MNAQELRDKRTKAWETAKAFLDSHRGENGILSAENAATYDKMEAEIVNLGKEIERLDRLEAIDKQMALPTSSPITGKPRKGTTDDKTGRGSEEYNKAFWGAMSKKYPSSDVLNFLSVGDDEDGGYLAPDEFEKKLIAGLDEENIMRLLCSKIKTASGDRRIPIVTSKGTADWVDEAGDLEATLSDNEFGIVTLGAHKLATMIKISDELLNDSVFDMESYISTEFSRRIGAKEEEAFIIGNGDGKPTGILAASNGADVGVTAASATAITADEIIDLVYSLKAPYRKGAAFLTNDLTVKAIRKIKDGTGQYIWQPSLTAGTPDTILNHPIHTSSFVPTAASNAKTIAFGDFSYYWIADRQGRVFKRLNELYAKNGLVGFLGSQRVDGKLVLSEAIKVLKQHA
jgi:HK97 family phage major capsid protein